MLGARSSLEMTVLRARVSRTMEQRTAASQKRDWVTERRAGEAESTRAPPESHEAWSKSQKLIMHSDRTTGSTVSALRLQVLRAVPCPCCSHVRKQETCLRMRVPRDKLETRRWRLGTSAATLPKARTLRPVARAATADMSLASRALLGATEATRRAKRPADCGVAAQMLRTARTTRSENCTTRYIASRVFRLLSSPSTVCCHSHVFLSATLLIAPCFVLSFVLFLTPSVRHSKNRKSVLQRKQEREKTKRREIR